MKGKRFGRLVVESKAARRGDYRARWKCRCDCGRSATVRDDSLKSGRTTSCGCLHKERTSHAHKKHGHSADYRHSPTYSSWHSMMLRCYTPSNFSYPRYGGKGITVCGRWHDFSNFISDMGERPEKRTLDRIDGSGNYEPANCRWATYSEQLNNRVNNVRINAFGKEHTIAEWSDITGLSQKLIGARIRRGWNPVRALTEEVQKR